MITEVTLDTNEKQLLKIRRTALGRAIFYLVAAVVLIGLLIAVFWIAKNQARVSANMPLPVALLVALVSAGLLILLDVVFIRVYDGNQMTLTNERIILMTQAGLFNQTVPQITLGDVQEVSVQQNGFFAHLFNYGTITIETAGEQRNIVLKYAANPHYVVQQVDNACEDFKSAPVRTPSS